MEKIRFLVLLLVAVLLAQNANATVCDFEDMTLGATYNVGGSFTTSGVDVTAGEFFLLPSGLITTGYAEVVSGVQAGGAGNGILTSNINLSFDFGFGLYCDGLSLQYGYMGGNINLEINGSPANVEDFASLPSSLGGTSVFTTSSSTGALFIIGTVNSFKIGGQELYIDNVVASVIPEPATIMLLGIGGLMTLTRKRRSA